MKAYGPGGATRFDQLLSDYTTLGGDQNPSG